MLSRTRYLVTPWSSALLELTYTSLDFRDRPCIGLLASVSTALVRGSRGLSIRWGTYTRGEGDLT